MGKKLGMRAMDDSLWELLMDDIITAEAAYEKAVEKSTFRDKLATVGIEIEG